jgi:WD40 repeat protein
VWRGVRAVAVTGEPTLAVPATPYRGIEPFRYADHAIFFARERETRLLTSLVDVYRGVFLYGDSGNGKSSLVNAGLLPHAYRLGFDPIRVRVQPREHEDLVIEQIAISDDGTELLPCVLAPEHEAGSRVVLSVEEFERRVRVASHERQPLLVFDQFEEISTLFGNANVVSSQRAIVEMIVRLLREPLPVKLLFAFREDYLGRVKELFAARPELVDQALRLGPPSVDALETIIRGPFLRFPGHFARELDKALADRLCAALAERFRTGEVSLSEVQTVCHRLWQSPDPSALFADKGVQGLLEEELGKALDALPSDLRAAAVALLGQMVTSAGTRNVISAEDLRQRVREDQEISPELLDEALERLERDSKLVRRERRHDLYLYEITSEFLLPWISQRREELRRDQERRRERRRLLILASIIGGLLITALLAALAIWALGQRAEAKRQADNSASGELAARATNLLGPDPGLSLALARRAVSVAPTEQAANALRQAVLGFRGLTVIRAGPGVVNGADLSPDGRRAASASADGRLRIWNLRTRRAVMTVKAHRGEARAVRFSPDGGTVVSGGADGSVVLTEVATGRRRIVIRTPEATVFSVAVARHGDCVASGYSDGTIRVAEMHGSRRVRVLHASKGGVFGVALSDDAARVAGAGLDGTARVWNLRGEHPPVVLHGSAGPVASVSFRPGHRGQLISADDKGWIRFWNAAAGIQESKMRADQQAIFAARFSPDGRQIATAGEDGAIHIIDAASKRVTAVLRGHSGPVYDVNFGAKGSLVISAGNDGTLRTWDPGTMRVMRGPVTNASISPDGRHVVAGGTDGTIRIWSVPSGMLEATLRGHTRRSYAQFLPDDSQVLSVSDDRTARVWNVASGQQQHVFRDHGEHAVYAAAADHDGRQVASAGADGRIVVRRLKGGPTVVLNGDHEAVNGVSFSPNDQWLLSAGQDGTIRIWDARRAYRPVRVLRGHSGAVYSATFSPDGQQVLSAGVDGTVRVWSLRGDRPVILRGHDGAVESATFSPTGNRIVTSGVDGTVRLWDPHGGEPLVTLHQYRGRAWSASFTPNGFDILSSGDDTVSLAPCGVCGSIADVLELARVRDNRQLSSAERERFLSRP